MLFLFLVLAGWFNIYASVYEDGKTGLISLSTDAGKQLLWIISAFLIAIAITFFDRKFILDIAFPFYAISIFLLIAVMFIGTEVSGSRSWFQLGPVSIQPSEFTKVACALALAKFIGSYNIKFRSIKNQAIAFSLIIVPMVLIILQGDTGTALVYSSFIFVLYREGISPYILMIGVGIVLLFVLTLFVNQLVLLIGLLVIGLIIIGLMPKKLPNIVLAVSSIVFVLLFVRSVDFFVTDVLKPHQQKRIIALINPNSDPLGAGWNVTQSKIAIGSGGMFGKGFLNGTQTKFDFVPAQSTDFIFCTVGEEHGWVGSTILIVAFTLLLLRIINLAERQKSSFNRIYGYGVASIIFVHFAINIAMTIGLFPVIGIPLPMISYGGSSLWTFTALIFIFLKLDSQRMQILER